MTNPTLSQKEREILEALINQNGLYGLQMVEQIPGLKRGTVYVTLNRMEDKGFVTSKEFKQPGWPGLPRQIYNITGLGERALKAARTSDAIMAGSHVYA